MTHEVQWPVPVSTSVAQVGAPSSTGGEGEQVTHADGRVWESDGHSWHQVGFDGFEVRRRHRVVPVMGQVYEMARDIGDADTAWTVERATEVARSVEYDDIALLEAAMALASKGLRENTAFDRRTYSSAIELLRLACAVARRRIKCDV